MDDLFDAESRRARRPPCSIARVDKHWDLRSLDVAPHRPVILHSAAARRARSRCSLPAGELLQDHQVHERAHLVVVDGEVDVVRGAGEPVTAGPGCFAVFDPGERHEVRARRPPRGCCSCSRRGPATGTRARATPDPCALARVGGRVSYFSW